MSSMNISPLLHLPREIRDEIWDYLFSITTIASGTFSFRGETTVFRPLPGALAILHVCRSVHKETRDLWLSRVTFDFVNIESALDKLASLPQDRLSQVRYMKVGGRPLALSSNPARFWDGLQYNVAEALTFLPGLQLDTLTVDTGYISSPVTKKLIASFLERGDGFRTLRVVVYNRPKYNDSMVRIWRHMLKDERDGENSDASVDVTQLEDENHLQRLIKQWPALKPGVMACEEWERCKLIVTIRRSSKAEIVQGKAHPPFNLQDLRDWTYGLSWDEIKKIVKEGKERDDAQDWKFEDELPIHCAVENIPRVYVDGY